MTFPNMPDKHSDPAIFTAAGRLAHRRRAGSAPRFEPPRAVILCYQPSLLAHVVKTQRVKRVGGFFGELYLLRKTRGQIAIAGNFGIGAPVVAVLVEEFAAFGVEQFVSIGMAGGLQQTLQAGDLVIAERAIRDEGTSHHYLPPAGYVAASTPLTQRLQQALDTGGTPYTGGTSWTTDAPYRETAREVARYQREGVLTVEMEAAALFGVGQYLGVEVGAAFAIGDSISGGRWQLDFDVGRTNRGLESLFAAALQALQR